MIGDGDEGSREPDARFGPSSWRLTVALLALLLPSAGHAAPACGPEGAQAVEIAGVTSDLGLLLSDGRAVLLAGVDPVRPTAAHPERPSEVRIKLERWLVGHPALLRPVTPEPDRWNRVAAFVFAPPAGTGAPLSVNVAMVDAGFARAHPDPGARTCWASLLAAEHDARAARLGLWDDPAYGIRAGRQATEPDESGAMIVVEGRIGRLGHGRSATYLRMGAIALRIANRDLSILSDLGLSQDQLVGIMLRVRGTLDDRFGPVIEVTDAQQIEVVTDGSALPVGATP